MFQKLKIKSAEKVVENCILQHQPKAVKSIQKMGVILDGSLLELGLKLALLEKELAAITKKYQLIIFSETEIENYLTYNKKDLSWRGKFKPMTEAANFQQEKFDVLINYFNLEKPELSILGACASSNMKIGFSPSVKKGLNDLSIKVDPLKVEVFIKELKKYLAIINQ
ncbi:hypothetical protein SAMN04488096_106159 [Mesonia phycicola]|uniref:Uncharacterized protein n=1 Tax=Mesonia phycicola TaxID=579105 RepID=A0A1M6FIL0_9FLAO|nr:hypothetical protein [Mesonia phycicola]SHI97442.1 hypothetical protein SAMN04488096_106159 [Mesonia phycicola]